MFYKKHVCRVEPFPPEELVPMLRHLNDDKTVCGTMQVVFSVLSLVTVFTCRTSSLLAKL